MELERMELLLDAGLWLNVPTASLTRTRWGLFVNERRLPCPSAGGRLRQPAHQSRCAVEADEWEQDHRSAHAGVQGRLLQLLVWHDVSGNVLLLGCCPFNAFVGMIWCPASFTFGWATLRIIRHNITGLILLHFYCPGFFRRFAAVCDTDMLAANPLSPVNWAEASVLGTCLSSTAHRRLIGLSPSTPHTHRAPRTCREAFLLRSRARYPAKIAHSLQGTSLPWRETIHILV